jgi:hypothetical protein
LYWFCTSLFLPASLQKIKNNRYYRIAFTTYEKSGQAVHPSLLYRPKGSPQFMLAFTPYPFSMDIFENPSILISNDGLRFFEETPGVNPLVSAPSFDHNNDPELFFYNESFNILYLETLRPKKQNLVLLTSGDRKTWNSRILHTDFFDKPVSDPFILSPSFIRDSHDACFLFYVKMNPPGSGPFRNNEIHYVAVQNGFVPDFSKRYTAAIDLKGLNPWHISLLKDDVTYYMLICCVKTLRRWKRYSLFIARSCNMKDWEFQDKVLLKNAYRAAGFIRNAVLYIYYSRQLFLGAWEMGVIKKNLYAYFQNP